MLEFMRNDITESFSLTEGESILIDGIRDAIWNLYEQLKEYKVDTLFKSCEYRLKKNLMGFLAAKQKVPQSMIY